MFGSVCFAEWFDLCQFGVVLCPRALIWSWLSMIYQYLLPSLVVDINVKCFMWKKKSQTLNTSFPQLVFRAVKENQGRFLATTIDILCRNLWWGWFLAVQTGSVQVAEGENQACKMLCWTMSLLHRVKLMTVDYEDRLLGASLHKGSRLVRATSSQAVPVMRRSNQDGYPPPPTSSHQPRLAH